MTTNRFELSRKRFAHVRNDQREHSRTVFNLGIRYRQSALRHHHLAKEKRNMHSNNCKRVIK